MPAKAKEKYIKAHKNEHLYNNSILLSELLHAYQGKGEIYKSSQE